MTSLTLYCWRLGTAFDWAKGDRYELVPSQWLESSQGLRFRRLGQMHKPHVTDWEGKWGCWRKPWQAFWRAKNLGGLGLFNYFKTFFSLSYASMHWELFKKRNLLLHLEKGQCYLRVAVSNREDFCYLYLFVVVLPIPRVIYLSTSPTPPSALPWLSTSLIFFHLPMLFGLWKASKSIT